MANQEHLDILKQGVEVWNQWRKKYPDIRPDLYDCDLTMPHLLEGKIHLANLSGVNFSETNLQRVELSAVNLSGANLQSATLDNANLSNSTLSEANLNKAKLNGAILMGTNFHRTTLTEAHLCDAILIDATMTEADLSGADLMGAILDRANLNKALLIKSKLRGTRLDSVTLREAKLCEAKFNEVSNKGRGTVNEYRVGKGNLVDLEIRSLIASLHKADLSGADLSGANFQKADLTEAVLIGANLKGANLSEAVLNGANLREADLSGANFTRAMLVETDLTNANLMNCLIYGISAWNVKLEGANQTNLNITRHDEPIITVDNLKVAQFIYLLLNNPKIREVIDTITSKVVLILGRFTPERKAVLDAIRDELRKRNYSPVLFDFEKPASRDLTETISTLAHLARFVIADITDAKSIPQELMMIVPSLPSVAVQPLILNSQHEYGMFEHFTRFSCVLPVYRYSDVGSLLNSLKECVIDPAEEKVKELRP